jgi:hypothetical protein
LENFENIIDNHSQDMRDMQRKDESDRQRKVLLPIVDTVTTLSKQNIALRGHQQEEGIISSNGTDPHLIDGNFRAISRLLIRRRDNELKHHCENANENGTMMSGRIENEIIEITKMMSYELLVEKIN